MPFLPLLLLAETASGGTQADQCWRKDVRGTAPVMVYVGDRACVELAPPRTMTGIWINAFEGSSFREGARTVEEALARRHDTWFSTDDQSRIPERYRGLLRRHHAYRVTFVGRNAVDMHRKPLEGYGHFGMSPGLALVDELVSLEDLGPLPER